MLKNNNDERVLIIVFVIIILLNYVYKNQKEKFEKKLHELNKEAKMKWKIMCKERNLLLAVDS